MSANFTAILLALDQGERRRARRFRLAVSAIKSSLALFLVVLLVKMLLIVGFYATCSHCGGPTSRDAYNDVINVTKAIVQFQLQHGDRCPRDLAEMKTAGVISRVMNDPWGRPFIIECSDALIRVCSGGRDEVDAEDDVCHEERPYEPTPTGLDMPPDPRSGSGP